MKRLKRGKGFLLFAICAAFCMMLFLGGGSSDSSDSNGGDTKHCTDDDYPLWCPDVGVCCTRGHPYYCDGYCYEEKQSGCAQYDTCRAE